MSYRTNRRTKGKFRVSRKAPRTTENYYRERLFEPIEGAEYATIESGEHKIVRMRTPGGEWITQAVLHPKTGAEYRKLCRRGKCPVGRD